jgi:hypothetical protein
VDLLGEVHFGRHRMQYAFGTVYLPQPYHLPREMQARIAEGVIQREHPDPQKDFPPSGYIDRWDEGSLLVRSLAPLGDAQFIAACQECARAEDLRVHLGLTLDDIEKRWQQCQNALHALIRQTRQPAQLGTMEGDHGLGLAPSISVCLEDLDADLPDADRNGLILIGMRPVGLHLNHGGRGAIASNFGR